MTTTIMVGCAKGGVGKSSNATSQAMNLANKGYRVLLVDFDAQANTTSYCGVQPGHGLYNLLVNGAEFEDVVAVVEPTLYGGGGTLWVLPTSDGSNYKIAEDIQDEMIVHDRFSELDDLGVDFCIIDTTPAVSKVHFGFMFASHWLLIPSACQLWSIQAVKSTLKYTREVYQIALQKHLNSAGVLGVLPTFFDQRKRVQRDALDSMKEIFPTYLLDPIHYAKEWEESIPSRMSLVRYKPRSRAAKESLALTDLILSKQVVTQ